MRRIPFGFLCSDMEEKSNIKKEIKPAKTNNYKFVLIKQLH
jgi:hypothetical protein